MKPVLWIAYPLSNFQSLKLAYNLVCFLCIIAPTWVRYILCHYDITASITVANSLDSGVSLVLSRVEQEDLCTQVRKVLTK